MSKSFHEFMNYFLSHFKTI